MSENRGENIANGDAYLDMVGDFFFFLGKTTKVMSMTVMVREPRGLLGMIVWVVVGDK